MNKVSAKRLFSNQIIVDYLKGLIVALLLSLGLIILFAFSLDWFNIKDVFIPAITLLIKGISVLIGSIIAIKGDSKGLLKGAAFGMIYIVLAFMIFSNLTVGIVSHIGKTKVISSPTRVSLRSSNSMCSSVTLVITPAA